MNTYSAHVEHRWTAVGIVLCDCQQKLTCAILKEAAKEENTTASRIRVVSTNKAYKRKIPPLQGRATLASDAGLADVITSEVGDTALSAAKVLDGLR